MNTRTTVLAVALLLVATMLWGCGRPQVAPKNLHLIASLRTALSTRNPEWLEQNAEIISQRHQGGKMSDDEYEAFQDILDAARAGDWQDAEHDAIAFQKAQRPTAEQVQRVSRHWHDGS